MGDVGSGFLGFSLGVLALGAARDDTAAPFVWLLLGGIFFVDATVTLARRLLRRERVYEAHRTHAYQWLARRWASHRRVTLVVIALDMIWLLPAAALATYYPRATPWLILCALGPLVVLALVVGAGRAEAKRSP
jgi:Fuc2NAc and GlcNAc transferase